MFCDILSSHTNKSINTLFLTLNLKFQYLSLSVNYLHFLSVIVDDNFAMDNFVNSGINCIFSFHSLTSFYIFLKTAHLKYYILYCSVNTQCGYHRRHIFVVAIS